MQFCLATYYFKNPRTISNVAAMDDNVEEIHLQRGDSWEADGSLIRVPKYYSELEANPDQWVLHRYFLVKVLPLLHYYNTLILLHSKAKLANIQL